MNQMIKLELRAGFWLLPINYCVIAFRNEKLKGGQLSVRLNAWQLIFNGGFRLDFTVLLCTVKPTDLVLILVQLVPSLNENPFLKKICYHRTSFMNNPTINNLASGFSG